MNPMKCNSLITWYICACGWQVGLINFIPRFDTISYNFHPRFRTNSSIIYPRFKTKSYIFKKTLVYGRSASWPYCQSMVATFLCWRNNNTKREKIQTDKRTILLHVRARRSIAWIWRFAVWIDTRVIFQNKEKKTTTTKMNAVKFMILKHWLVLLPMHAFGKFANHAKEIGIDRAHFTYLNNCKRKKNFYRNFTIFAT